MADKDEVLGTCDYYEYPHRYSDNGRTHCINWKPNAPAPQAAPEPVEQGEPEPARERNRHRFMAGTCVDCGHPLDPICNANRDAPAPHVLGEGADHVGIPCPPEYSATCPICGAMVKPGEKCLSCGEPSPAPSEPTLPPLPNPIATSKYWDAGIDRPLAGERAARLERQDQLLAAQREIQQLRQRAEDAEAKVRGLSARFICQAELEGGKHAHGHTIQDIYDDRDASDGWTHDC